jgi:MFS family permease
MTNSEAAQSHSPALSDSKTTYNRFLLLVAGLGGLLYGVDVGIIGGALPYLEATSHLNAGQLSIIVAAVLLGSVISTLFAGLLAVIALSHGYSPLFFGRLLQGISGGLIGIVVPLYLAECLKASTRGKGTGVFQWLLTLGVVSAALIGIYYSYRVAAVERVASPAAIFMFKNQAWRRIFWVSLPPGLLFVLGSFFLAESPRWLFKRGKKDQAYAALLRSRTKEQADVELSEMEETAHAAHAQATSATGERTKDSLLRRKYVVPFLLACAILLVNQATGINSLIAYNTGILLQSGLSDVSAHWGYVIFTCVNFLVTIVGMTLVDSKGRKFLFILGTSGIIVSMVGVGLLFIHTERANLDCRNAIQAMVRPDQTLTLPFDSEMAKKLLAAKDYSGNAIVPDRASLEVIYSYGGFTAATSFVRSDEKGAAPIHITREAAIPNSKFEAMLKDPFANVEAARRAPLRIQKAVLGQVPNAGHGWLVALGLYMFMAFYALGPGVCVWLALSELMPTRIRSNGMSIALVLNQMVSTILAGIFLPFVSKYGYSRIFFLFAACTVLYLLIVAIFLPETKGKTLEEIEEYFDNPKRSRALAS